MPSYNWSCLACGVCNQPSAIACKACGCSPVATYAEIARRRESHVANGGEVLHNAAVQEDPLPEYLDRQSTGLVVPKWIAPVAILVPSSFIYFRLPGWMQVAFDPRIVALGLMMGIAGVIGIVGLSLRGFRKVRGERGAPPGNAGNGNQTTGL